LAAKVSGASKKNAKIRLTSLGKTFNIRINQIKLKQYGDWACGEIVFCAYV
jgi:hypothetical protein